MRQRIVSLSRTKYCSRAVWFGYSLDLNLFWFKYSLDLNLFWFGYSLDLNLVWLRTFLTASLVRIWNPSPKIQKYRIR